MTLYYEDFEVGDSFETGTYTLSESEIISFAEQFDPQPFHTDKKAAAESIFGGLVASGLHTLCLSVRLFVTGFIEKESVANSGALGMDELRWHKPVRPGDTIHIQIDVTDKRRSKSRSDRGYVEFRRSVHTAESEVMSVRSQNIIATSETE